MRGLQYILFKTRFDQKSGPDPPNLIPEPCIKNHLSPNHHNGRTFSRPKRKILIFERRRRRRRENGVCDSSFDTSICAIHDILPPWWCKIDYCGRNIGWMEGARTSQQHTQPLGWVCQIQSRRHSQYVSHSFFNFFSKILWSILTKGFWDEP